MISKSTLCINHVGMLGCQIHKLGFVDDLNDIMETLKAALRLQDAVDRVFAKLGAKVKGWAIAGLSPAPEISKNGYVGVAGSAWHA